MADQPAKAGATEAAAGDRTALLKRALLKIESLEARLAEAGKTRHEPIAIVGMGCRLPAGANDPEAFWELLERGTDAISEPPPSRWDFDRYFDADPEAAGKAYTMKGGFIEDVDHFDAPFFGIAPREAQQMDPQQRWLLQVTWEALEDAGIAPASLVNSRTGVYVGMTGSDFLFLQTGNDPRNIDTYLASGTSHAVAAGRLSYVLGLRGPAMTIDTACSSALLAVHLACNSLRLGECDAALAGGVLLILSPEGYVSACKARLLSPDGHCKSFDDAADGYVRAEGCAMVALKRLSDARRDGDRILAVIRGSASNQDGRSGGLTAPSGKAQEAVIREALANAGVRPAEVSYVEAHGTGTSLGDPIEVQALASVYAAERDSSRPLLIGSVKSNIGHTEGVAGVAGLIKLVLSLNRERIPGNLQFKTPNSHIPWDEVPLVVADRTQEWPQWAERKLGGVSSFGFSGSNVHMLVEQAPPVAVAAGIERPRHLLALSARRPDGLRELAARHAARLSRAENETGIADYCYTANTGRNHFEYRAAASGSTPAELLAELRLFADDEPGGALCGDKVQPHATIGAAFLFPSAAAVRAGMGRALFESQPSFRKTLIECEGLLAGRLERPLSAVLYPTGQEDTEALLAGAGYAWPAMFALQWALTRLWESYGVTPAAVTGFGSGELAAACAAGVLRFEDGLLLAAEAGRRLADSREAGAMAAVFAGEDQVRGQVGDLEGVAVAAANGPRSVVLSGTREGIAAALARCDAEGIGASNLGQAAPLQTRRMAAAAAEIAALARAFEHRPPLVDFVSGVTGRLADGPDAPRPDYWASLVSAELRTADTARVLYARGCRTFIEIGPRATLCGLLRQATPGMPATWLPSLRADGDDWRQLCAAVARLYVDGMEVDWRGFDRDYPRNKVSVPTYPFERQSYAIRSLEPPREAEPEASGPHRLLGRRLSSPRIAEHVWEIRLRADSPAFAGFGYHGCRVVPPGALLDAMLAAAREAQPGRRVGITTVRHTRVLPLADEALVQTVAARDDDGLLEILASGAGGEWRTHASARVVTDVQGSQAAVLPEPHDRPGRRHDTLSGARFYELLADAGISTGEAERVIESLTPGDGEVFAAVIPGGGSGREALTEACLQVLQMSLPRPALLKPGAPPGILDEAERFWLDTDLPARLELHGRLRAPGAAVADLGIYGGDARLVGELAGVRFRPLGREELPQAWRERLQTWLYDITWERKKRETAVPRGGVTRRWLLLADQGGCAAAAAALLGGDATLLAADALNGGAATLGRWLTESGRCGPGVTLVYCPSLDVEAPAADAAAPSAALADSCNRVLALATALAGMDPAAQPALTIVTRGAQPAPGGDVRFAQAPFVGLQRVLGNELPELRASVIDLDPALDPAAAAAQLCDELRAPDESERQVALRGGKRLVPRLARLDETQNDSAWAAFEPGDGSFLVTGGLGGIGLSVAAWLVERGARSLYLIGRSAPSQDARHRISEFEAAGASVVILNADVADHQALNDALATIRAGGHELRGVFHAAGVIDDALVVNQNVSRIEKVMRPKVDGAWHLHTLTATDKLEHFVMFSAAAALFGNPGQSNYAAANLFLDGLAHHRRALGLPALSINWGAWSQVGMAAGLGEEAHQRWAELGVGDIAPEEGPAAMELAMGAGVAQVAIAPINWKQWRRAAGMEPPPFTRNLMQSTEEEPSGRPSIPVLLEELASAGAGRGLQLGNYVAAQLAALLGLSPAGIERERPVSDLGFDSLMATTLKTRIEADLGINVPVAALLDGPSTHDLADRLLAVFDAGKARPPAATAGDGAEWEEGAL